jgi:hypothetical protein
LPRDGCSLALGKAFFYGSIEWLPTNVGLS